MKQDCKFLTSPTCSALKNTLSCPLSKKFLPMHFAARCKKNNRQT